MVQARSRLHRTLACVDHGAATAWQAVPLPMSSPRKCKVAETLGFLSVKQHAEHGYFGGYLVLNTNARPLEFHCTMPVKPSRAQEVLYGPTIDDFVCGEQIAKALISKAKLTPDWLITDCQAVLAVANVSDMPIVMIQCESSCASSGSNLRTPASRTNSHCYRTSEREFYFPLAGANSPADSLPDRERGLRSLLGSLSSSFEIDEPFQRITEALLEAHPIAKAA